MANPVTERHRRGNSTEGLASGLPPRSGTVLKEPPMIRKLKSGKYRLYSRKFDARTHKRRNLGTFDSREAAEKHEREVQYFKRH
jgi:hypothetical protein